MKRQGTHFSWRASSRFSTASTAALLALGCGASSSQGASLTGLGHLTNYGYSAAHDVSADGSVVTGAVYTHFFVTEQAFRWTRSGGMVGLGFVSDDAQQSRGDAISADGSVIVGGDFIWTSTLGMAPLVTPPVNASGVSADGSIVAGSTGVEAFRWSAATGLVGLGDLPGGNFYSGAIDISADGKVIVGSGQNESAEEAFRWTEEGGMVGLGYIPGSPGGSLGRSAAIATSDDGSVVVGLNASAQGDEAFRWTESEGMVGLGYLGTGGFASIAWGVSGDGRTIGGHSANEEGENAFIWTRTRGMRSLWDILESHGINPAVSGWSGFTYALGISFDGRIVVGVGQRNGTDEAFIADLTPELTFSLVPSGLQIRWPTGYQIQRTTAINSEPWQNVIAVQPLTVSFGAANEFFRLVEDL